MLLDKLIADFQTSVAALPQDKPEVLEFHTEGEVHFTVATVPRGTAAAMQLVLTANPEHAAGKPGLTILASHAPMVLRRWLAHYMPDRSKPGSFRRVAA